MRQAGPFYSVSPFEEAERGYAPFHTEWHTASHCEAQSCWPVLEKFARVQACKVESLKKRPHTHSLQVVREDASGAAAAPAGVVVLRALCFRTTIEVVRGSILDCRCDGIVNAANEMLDHAGGAHAYLRASDIFDNTTHRRCLQIWT